MAAADRVATRARPVGSSARWDWRQFREVPVSEIDNKIRLSTIGAIGHATGVGGVSENDRRFLVLRDLEATDVEIAAQFLPGVLAQFGLALRVGPTGAIVVWHNIVHRGSARLLHGVWEYDGTSLHTTNQQDVYSPGFEQVALGAVGDGTTMTVTTAEPHHVGRGTVVAHGGDLAGLGMAFVHATPGPSTYTFLSPLVGTWGPGTWQTLAMDEPRWVAMRLVGGRVSFKQWLPRDLEPSWDDPNRTIVNELPAVMTSGNPPPSGPGGVGVMIGHLGDGRRIEVRDLRVTPLD